MPVFSNNFFLLLSLQRTVNYYTMLLSVNFTGKCCHYQWNLLL